MDRELARILWRQALLATPEGLAWLVVNARSKERDVGPHRKDAPYAP
jgi:hypothetical protein